ncbi:putative transmembrane protein ZNF593OS [Dicentrarchus labrax]|uniref:putative transmembrane protein ZNF593OS n=1 Tax=Dicentrarchus labrax TaxID=13489 RepID=UPI0021F5377E|nr:putative transmembrane protein ZNF593OS [Dicentrarchus labrax]
MPRCPPIKALRREQSVRFIPTQTEPVPPKNPNPEPQCSCLESHPSSSLCLDPPHTTSTDMIIRLGRLTPGYFRLLQRQVAGEVQTQPQDRAVNQIAMMLAIMGLSLSYYSAKQMTEKVQVQPGP